MRQLRNVLRTLVALCEDGCIQFSELPVVVRAGCPPVRRQAGSYGDDAVGAGLPANRAALEHAERQALLDVLEANRWHLTHVAEHLGISRNTLYRKLRKHGIARAG